MNTRPEFRGDPRDMIALERYEQDLRAWEAKRTSEALLEDIALVKAAEEKLVKERVMLVKNHGATILFGSGVPDSSHGVDGQGWLDWETLDVFLKVNGQWELINSLASEASAGPSGAPGEDGQAGPGVPIGGTVDQYLKKDSGTDFDTSWATFDGDTIRVTSDAVDDSISAFTVMKFDTEDFNNGPFTHDGVSNFSIKVLKAGKYLVGALIYFQGGLSGGPSDVQTRVRFRKAGGGSFSVINKRFEAAQSNVSITIQHSIMAVTVMDLAVNDAIQVQARRSSGIPEVRTDYTHCEFWMVQLK